MCGYTDADLDTVFAAELPGLDRAEIRDWYNGYNWRVKERVYNPFDILLLFERREFGAWWFETGTPAFLIDTLMARGVGSRPLLRGTITREIATGPPVVARSSTCSEATFQSADAGPFDQPALNLSISRPTIRD